MIETVQLWKCKSARCNGLRVWGTAAPDFTTVAFLLCEKGCSTKHVAHVFSRMGTRRWDPVKERYVIERVQ